MERQKSRERWYESAFRETYPITYPHRDDASAAREIAAIVRLVGIDGGSVLDLCCGTGRHAAALAESGFGVTGLDLSAPLLAKAGARPRLAGRLARGDMRRLPFGRRFDAVVNLFTSLGYFAEDAQNGKVAAEMHRVLRPGGRVVIDHMNVPSVERSVGEDERAEGPRTVRQRRWIEGNRVRKEVVIMEKDRDPVRVLEDVRLYRPEEMKALLEGVGFDEVRLLGSVNGDALTSASDRMIAVGRRP
ncbi:MAG: class I SAM-dependent methyltransferase [Planctomycetota bacterium]